MRSEDTMVDRYGSVRREEPRDLEGEAMHRRIAARLFGGDFDAVSIGRFQVVEALGHGGMGVVYAADDDQLDRQVAIKVIRDDSLRDGPGERGRLLREARALAKLSHPNVVQVYEVGEHDGGVFIVMELVRGTTLRNWLANAPRTLPEVLQHFIAAGQGLAAAHRVGIVHRDFKPANALVGEDGRVRIADFGLARGEASGAETIPGAPIEPGSRGGSGSTGSTAMPAGTPGYMAPEQLLGAPCDARSDQFSFCVALFEAVYGRAPVAAGSMGPRAVARTSMSGARRVPGWLRRLLVRGLATRPEHRHASMTVLITALQETPRRRRRVAQGIGVLALGLAAALGGTLLASEAQQAVCSDPGEPIAAVWNSTRRAAVGEAFTETGLAHASLSLARVMQATDEYAERWTHAQGKVCKTTWVNNGKPVEELDASVVCLDDALASLDASLAVLQTADAEIVAGSDELLAALPDPARCLVEALLPAHIDEPVLRGLLDRAKIAFHTGQGAVAAALLGVVVPLLRARDDPSAEAEASLLLGKVEGRLLRQAARARQSLDTAMKLAARAKRYELVWEIWNEHAWVSASEPDGAGARRAYEQARGGLPASIDATIDAALGLVESRVLLAEGRTKAAVQRGRQVIALLQEHRPAEHPDVVAAQAALAMTLGDAGETAEALDWDRELLATLVRSFGAEHPATARVELNLGVGQLESGNYEEALRHVEHARAVLMASHGREHPRVAAADLALAMLDAADGQIDRAIDRARAASAVYSESFPPGSPERISALVLLAGLYQADGRTPELLAVNLELLALDGESGSKDDGIDRPMLLANIGDGLCEMKRCPEALEYFVALQAIVRRDATAGPTLEALALRGMGLVLRAAGESALAVQSLEQAVALFQAPGASPGMEGMIVACAREAADVMAALRRSPAKVRALRALADRIEGELAAEQAAAPAP